MREGDTGPVFPDVNPDVSLVHPHLLLRVSLYLGNPKMLHVCSGTFSPGIGISTWNTHSSVRPSTVEDLHCTWSPLVCGISNTLNLEVYTVPPRYALGLNKLP